MVEPTGVPASMDTRIPKKAHMTERTAAQIVTVLKLRSRRIADSAGKITNADMSSEPTRFIASTIITAITMDISRLYRSAFVPIAFEKLSSKVTAKILL